MTKSNEEKNNIKDPDTLLKLFFYKLKEYEANPDYAILADTGFGSNFFTEISSITYTFQQPVGEVISIVIRHQRRNYNSIEQLKSAIRIEVKL